MGKELVMLLDDISWELGAEDAINYIKEMYEKLNESGLVQLIKEMIDRDTERSAAKARVGIYKNFNEDQLQDTEVIAFIGSEFEYKDFLLAVLALLMFIDKHKRPL